MPMLHFHTHQSTNIVIPEPFSHIADAYVAAAVISQQLPGMLCIKRKQETVLCRGLVTEEMAGCIVQLHSFTGCDANRLWQG